MPIHWVSWSDWLQAWFIRFINWIQTMPTSNQLSIFSIFACVLVNTHKGLLDPLLPNISSWLLGGSLLWYLKVILPSAYFFMSIILATLYHILFSNALQAQFCNPCENHCLLNFVSTAIYVSIIQGWLLHTLDYKILIIFWALHRLRWCRVEISTFPIIKLIVVKSSRWKCKKCNLLIYVLNLFKRTLIFFNTVACFAWSMPFRLRSLNIVLYSSFSHPSTKSPIPQY